MSQYPASRTAALRGAKQPEECAGCHWWEYGPQDLAQPLHSCENFPLPQWATVYLAAFDSILSGDDMPRYVQTDSGVACLPVRLADPADLAAIRGAA